MSRPALAMMLFAAACAKGSAADLDARPGIDARAGGPDAAPGAPDAAPGAPDAAIADATPGAPDAATADATVSLPDAMVTPDAMIAMPDAGIVLGDGDTCATANEITAQATSAGGFSFSGDTGPLADDIDVPSACTGYGNSGSDAIFKLSVNAGQTITATLNTSWDGAIEIVPTCSAAPTCLAGSDDIAGGGTETVTATAPSTSTYYVVVDSYDFLFEYGTYTLTVKVQ